MARDQSSTENGSPEFAALVAPHRRALLVHCYRMLGSWTEAEDALQDALLRAWQAHARFEGRAALGTWLYRIATNVCLSRLSSQHARAIPQSLGPAADSDQNMASALEEARWIEPAPDHLIVDPQTRAIERESVALAFVVALQRLAPRQRAVLLLRDVLDYEATEVAHMLETSVASVTSALARARLGLEQARSALSMASAPTSLEQAQLLERYVKAWEARDIETLVALLRADADFSMPPYPTWFKGRAAIESVLRNRIFAQERRFLLKPTSAGGQPAFILYKADKSNPVFHAHGVQVVWAGRDEVHSVVTFLQPGLVTGFGFPPVP